MPSLYYLHLQNNKISTIQKDSFESMNLFKGVYLQGNLLNSLSVLHIKLTANFFIALNRNPVACSCNLSWITRRDFILSSGAKCKHPETNSTYYLKQFLVSYCKEPPSNISLDDSSGKGEYTHLIILNSVLLVLAVTVAVTVFVIIRHFMCLNNEVSSDTISHN